MISAVIKHMTSATRSDIIGFVYEQLHKSGWKTSFNYYMQKPLKFLNKPLIVHEGSRPEFNRFVNYCFLLSKKFTDQDEAARYLDRNGVSIYFSVVLYWLLISFGVVNEKRLKFCQGYYSCAVNGTEADGAKYRAGIHSWLSCNGSVIDVTLWRQQGFRESGQQGFPESGEPDAARIIKGKLPENLNLIGFEEDKSLAKEYARQFAKDSGLTFYNWINHHREQADFLSNVRKLEQEISAGC